MEGLVGEPHEFSMDELVSSFPSLKIPITLTCDGKFSLSISNFKFNLYQQK